MQSIMMKTVFQDKYSGRGMQNKMKNENGYKELKKILTLGSYFIEFTQQYKNDPLQHT